MTQFYRATDSFVAGVKVDGVDREVAVANGQVVSEDNPAVAAAPALFEMLDEAVESGSGRRRRTQQSTGN